MAALVRTGYGVGQARTNSSGSPSPPTTGGSCDRWTRTYYAKNCQRKKLRRETIPTLESNMSLGGGRRHDRDRLMSHALDRIEYCGDIDRQSFQQYRGRQRATPEDAMFDVGPTLQP